MGFNPEFLNRSRRRASPEAHLVLQIIKYITYKGGWARKIKTKGSFTTKGNFIYDRYQARGVPDILYFYNQRMGWIEAKSPTGRQSCEQEQFELLCKTAGIPYLLARSLEDVQKIM